MKPKAHEGEWRVLRLVLSATSGGALKVGWRGFKKCARMHSRSCGTNSHARPFRSQLKRGRRGHLAKRRGWRQCCSLERKEGSLTAFAVEIDGKVARFRPSMGSEGERGAEKGSGERTRASRRVEKRVEGRGRLLVDGGRVGSQRRMGTWVGSRRRMGTWVDRRYSLSTGSQDGGWSGIADMLSLGGSRRRGEGQRGGAPRGGAHRRRWWLSGFPGLAQEEGNGSGGLE